MLSDNPFLSLFLPMMLVGYNTMYPGIFDYTGVLKEPYLTDIPKYTTVFMTSLSSMVLCLLIKSWKRSLPILSMIRWETATARHFRRWKIIIHTWVGSQIKKLIWHCKNDDCVPFGNLVAARDRFSTLGISNIEYVEWRLLIMTQAAARACVCCANSFHGRRQVDLPSDEKIIKKEAGPTGTASYHKMVLITC